METLSKVAEFLFYWFVVAFFVAMFVGRIFKEKGENDYE